MDQNTVWGFKKIIIISELVYSNQKDKNRKTGLYTHIFFYSHPSKQLLVGWRRAWQPTTVFLPGEFHGQRSLTGYTP